MRTPISLQARMVGPDGVASSGTLCAAADASTTNDGESYPSTAVCGVLDRFGRLVAQSYHALQVWASDDADTEEAGVAYTFILSIDGQRLVEFNAPVPAASTADETNGATLTGSPKVGLSDLIAAAAMVGQSITGTNIPGATTVLDFDDLANTLTLSADATGDTSDGAFTIGGAVSLIMLQTDAT